MGLHCGRGGYIGRMLMYPPKENSLVPELSESAPRTLPRIHFSCFLGWGGGYAKLKLVFQDTVSC